MSLYSSLKLKITALRYSQVQIINTVSEGFDSILTQAEDSLITQSNILLVRQTVLYNLITQDNLFFTTQDDRIVQAGF